MRIFLTLVAVVLVAVLTAALVGPMFVDWSAQRGIVEAELSRRLGSPVTVAGAIELRLLPAPYLAISDVSVGKPGGDFQVHADRMRFEVGLGGLAAGQLRFTEARLERPVATVQLGDDDAFPAPKLKNVGLAALVDRIALERFTVDEGVLTIARKSGQLVLKNLSIDLSAKSLKGPFRASGRFNPGSGGPIDYQIASAEADAGGAPVKAEFASGRGGTAAVFDGTLSFPKGKAGYAPRFAGSALFTGTLSEVDSGGPSPWKIAGPLRADLHAAAMETATISIGPDTRAVEATGPLQASFRPDGLSVGADLNAKQLNFDSLLRREGEPAAPPSRLSHALTAMLGSIDASAPVTLDLKLAAPTAFLGAGTIDSIALQLHAAPGKPVDLTSSADFPGHSHIAVDGALELGPAANFRGRLDSRIGDLSAFAAWFAQGDPDLTQRMQTLAEAAGAAPIGLSGGVAVSSVGFSSQDIHVALDRTSFTGAVALTLESADEHGRLYADLRTDALDIDATPNLIAGRQWLGGLDLTLSIEAGKLRIARVGQSSVEGGSLALKVSKAGDTLSLDKLTLSDLGGATVDAQGEATPEREWLKVNVDAAHLRDFAALVARAAPGRETRWLVDRAEALSPAKASFEARREGEVRSGAFPLDFLKADGQAAQSRFSLKISNAPQPVDALNGELSLDAPEGTTLLRQLGLKVLGANAGRAHVTASLNGRWERGYDAKASVDLAGAALDWRGRVTPAAADPNQALAFGAVTAKTSNVFPALQLFGLSPGGASAPALPADLGADIVYRDGEISTPRLTGSLGASKIVGQLAWRPLASIESALASDPIDALVKSAAGDVAAIAPVSADVTGEISVDRAPLTALLAIPLGATPAKAGTGWSEEKFAPPLLTPPPTDITLRVGQLDLWDGAQARGATARLRMDPGKFDLSDLALEGTAGRASGSVTLHRDAGLAAFSGKLDWQDYPVERPALRGKVSAALEFAGTGRSPAGLMGGLAGQGSVRVSGLSIPRLDPDALTRLLAKAQAQDAQIDETNVTHTFGLELDKQALTIPDATAQATLNSGVARVGPFTVGTSAGRVALTADLDLRSFDFGLRALFSATSGGKFWSGAPPAATVTVQGPLDAPKRTIDAGILSAGLATQALAREADRIANLEADLRERAFFNRRLKADEFLRESEAENEAYDQEQARLKSEAERRGVEDGLMQTYQDQLRAAEAARAAAEKAKADEAARLVAEKARADEAAKAAAEKARADEAARLIAEKAKADEAARLAAEKAKADNEAAKAAAVEKASAEQTRARENAKTPGASDFPLPPNIPPPALGGPASQSDSKDPTANGLY